VTNYARGKLRNFRLNFIRLHWFDTNCQETRKIKITPSVLWLTAFNIKRDLICTDSSLSSGLRHICTKLKSRPHAKYQAEVLRPETILSFLQLVYTLTKTKTYHENSLRSTIVSTLSHFNRLSDLTYTPKFSSPFSSKHNRRHSTSLLPAAPANK
jgi:hypothetical protein